MRIDRHPIGDASPPFIIAELSGNHGGSLEKATALVDAVAASGAQAVKLQTFTPDDMTLDLARGEFLVEDPSSPWFGESLYRLYERAQTPVEWHAPLFDRARSLGLVPFSTPYTPATVDVLEALDAPVYKIASFENTDVALIRRAAETGRPLIISTGMATLDEITLAVETARGAGCRDLVLLQCTSSYPADPADSNLLTIPDLARRFECPVGLSDHTPGIGAAVASVALGARVIEKHVTLDRSEGDVDASFSLEPGELEALVTETHRAWRALGGVHYGPTDAERQGLLHRRSLYVTSDVRAGDVVGPDNVRAIRPGLGLPVAEFASVSGRSFALDVSRGTPLDWSLLA